jgi:hypothetical protein
MVVVGTSLSAALSVIEAKDIVSEMGAIRDTGVAVVVTHAGRTQRIRTRIHTPAGAQHTQDRDVRGPTELRIRADDAVYSRVLRPYAYGVGGLVRYES